MATIDSEHHAALDEFIEFSTATHLIPGRPHCSTLWRWARRGVKARGQNTRIRLRHVRAGARLLTTRAWLTEFMQALADADSAHFSTEPEVPVPTPKGRTEAQRAADVAAAKKRLGCRS